MVSVMSYPCMLCVGSVCLVVIFGVVVILLLNVMEVLRCPVG